MNVALTTLLLAGTMLVSGQAMARAVSIAGLNFNGTGCKNDGVDATAQLFDVDLDGLDDQFQILYSSYVVKSPGGDTRKNCTITVTLNLPQGFQFSIANASYIGFADIPIQGLGVQEATYLFPLNPQGGRATMRSVISGPYTRLYERTDTLGIASYVWSPCGLNAPLTIRTQAYLNGNLNPKAELTVDETDFKVKQIYGLTWRRCS
jgi:hypothetical protein